MRKRKEYDGQISVAAIRQIVELVCKPLNDKSFRFVHIWLSCGAESWTFDDIETFYRRAQAHGTAAIMIEGKNDKGLSLEISSTPRKLSITITAKEEAIEKNFSIVEDIFHQVPLSEGINNIINREFLFNNVAFLWPVIDRAIIKFRSVFGENIRINNVQISSDSERVSINDLPTISKYYSEMIFKSFYIYISDHDEINKLSISFTFDGTSISVSSKDDSKIYNILSVFNNCHNDEKVPYPRRPIESNTKPVIFIGHGRNRQWEKLKSHLQDKHGFEVVAYESGSRAGHTIRDILLNMSDRSTMALLVLTGEDKTERGLRARQNVIHECGLFQGKLGFERAILLVEPGVEMASNFDGIQQIRFRKGRIIETFGDVIATIGREFSLA